MFCPRMVFSFRERKSGWSCSCLSFRDRKFFMWGGCPAVLRHLSGGDFLCKQIKKKHWFCKSGICVEDFDVVNFRELSGICSSTSKCLLLTMENDRVPQVWLFAKHKKQTFRAWQSCRTWNSKIRRVVFIVLSVHLPTYWSYRSILFRIVGWVYCHHHQHYHHRHHRHDRRLQGVTTSARVIRSARRVSIGKAQLVQPDGHRPIWKKHAFPKLKTQNVG